MLRVDRQGGFGEKGRTSLGVGDGRTAIVFDLGIKVGAGGDDYYPVLARPVDDIDAIFISHAHEDHVGGLCRALSHGYSGPVYMTAETRAEMLPTLRQYADGDDLRDFPPRDDRIVLFRPGDVIGIGSLSVSTGHSGHVAGGVWFCAAGGGHQVAYAADMVPGSTVFRMEPLPASDLLILDASYGADPIPGSERAGQIAEWIAAHAGGCLLPTPLSGRSLELIAVLDAPFAIEGGMRPALTAQIEAGDALQPGLAARLRGRLAAARNWHVGEPLPACPLLVHDGMGVAGPSREAIAEADRSGYPILLTGHLPQGSPAAILAEARRAGWVRMPTHPTMPENVALWEAMGRPPVLGHSCEPPALRELQQHIPALDVNARTGRSLTLGEERDSARSAIKR